MDEHDWLAERFEANRTHLRAVAYRMLGSLSEADDAVQEAWLRLSRADTSERREPRRLADDGRRARVPGHAALAQVAARGAAGRARCPSRSSSREDGIDPEHEALLADSVGLALLVVLETLAPAERVAFVLHDMFDVPFDEIAPIVGRSPTAARQLASRARRRVQGSGRGPRRRSHPPARGRRRVPRGLARRRLRRAARGARPRRRAPRRPGAVQASAAARDRGAPALARKSTVQQPWPRPSRGARGPRGRRSSTASRDWSGRRADSRVPCSPSRWRAARSSKSS